MNYPQRMYSKTELGLLYFPDTTDGATARRHIMVWIKRCEAGGNRVGGKRSSFLPTFVFRPLTPPYVRFRIRRFLFWIPFEIRIN